MTDKDSGSQQIPAENTVNSRPPPYSSELPPWYLQQPGNYQRPPSFQAPPAYHILPGYQAPPFLQPQPGYEIPPGYQGPPAYQSLPGYPRQVYQGAPNDSVIASQPGSYIIQPTCTSMQNIPPDYQALSWFACLCCCWPLGIVAILKSNEVKSSLSRGDFNSARIASNSARNFAYTAIGVGISFIVMYIIAMILVFTMFLSN